MFRLSTYEDALNGSGFEPDFDNFDEKKVFELDREIIKLEMKRDAAIERADIENRNLYDNERRQCEKLDKKIKSLQKEKKQYEAILAEEAWEDVYIGGCDEVGGIDPVWDLE